MRLSTIGFMCTLALAIVVAPLATEAQQARVPTIGVLVVGAPSAEKFWRLFRDGMRELGYIEGQSVLAPSKLGVSCRVKVPVG